MRRLLALLTIVLVLLGVGLALPTNYLHVDRLDARQVRFNDSTGKLVALIAADKGGPWMNFFDPAGHDRIILSFTDGKAGLYLMDEKGEPSIVSKVTGDAALMYLTDEHYRRLEMSVTDENKWDPVIRLFAEDGHADTITTGRKAGTTSAPDLLDPGRR